MIGRGLALTEPLRSPEAEAYEGPSMIAHSELGGGSVLNADPVVAVLEAVVHAPVGVGEQIPLRFTGGGQELHVGMADPAVIRPRSLQCQLHAASARHRFTVTRDRTSARSDLPPDHARIRALAQSPVGLAHRGRDAT